jgi:hypothetical protein
MYDNLLGEFGKYSGQLITYKEQCYWLSKLILTGLWEYFGCDSHKLFPVNSQNERAHVKDALHIGEASSKENGLTYEFDVQIIFDYIVNVKTPSGDETHHDTHGYLNFCILITKQGDQFSLGVKHVDQHWIRISEDVLSQEDRHNHPKLQELYQLVFKEIRDVYSNGFEKALKGEEQKFGFGLR